MTSIQQTQQQILVAQDENKQRWKTLQAEMLVRDQRQREIQDVQQQIVAAQEEEARRWETFKTQMEVRDQRQKDTIAMLHNIYALMDQRTRAKDARNRERHERPTPVREGGNPTSRRPLADIQVRPPLAEVAAQAPQPAPQIHRMLSEDRAEVIFPIRHEDDGAHDRIYEPVRIPTAKFDDMKVRCSTPTNFVRNLLIYFFDAETRKSANFNGTRVLANRGWVHKNRLDRRIVLTMLDQVELQFPGSTTDKDQHSKIVVAINDKCRHS